MKENIKMVYAGQYFLDVIRLSINGNGMCIFQLFELIYGDRGDWDYANTDMGVKKHLVEYYNSLAYNDEQIVLDKNGKVIFVELLKMKEDSKNIKIDLVV